MTFSTNVVNILFSNIWIKIISLFVSYVLCKLSVFYLKVWSLPPGPFPLPLIGNILLFRSGSHFTDIFRKCAEKYGPVFTFWIGNRPFIFISDLNIAKDAFRQIEFSGRAEGYLKKWFSKEKHRDVIFSEGTTHESLRGVTTSAVNKYLRGEEFFNCLNDCVETTVKEIIDMEGVDKQFSPKEYIYNLFFSFMFKTTFGRDFKTNDQEFIRAKTLITDFTGDLGTKMPLWELSPLIRILQWKTIKRYEMKIESGLKTIRDLYKTYEKDYNESNERNICDSVITARNTAIREEKVSAKHLIDDNLSQCMFDILGAGTSTTSDTFVWGLLFMTYYPEIQQILRKEIESQIGERMPTLQDRDHCHYVMAFISETLRMRNVLPMGLPHKTLSVCKLANYTIPEETNVFVINQIISTDDKYWPNGQQFRTERFLKNGKYTTNRSEANIAFGIGRRMCLGERFAQANLFLALVRFLQLTMKYDMILGTNGGIEPDPNQAVLFIPRKFKLILKTRQ